MFDTQKINTKSHAKDRGITFRHISGNKFDNSLLVFQSNEDLIVYPQRRINIIDREKKEKGHSISNEVHKQFQNKKTAKYNVTCKVVGKDDAKTGCKGVSKFKISKCYVHLCLIPIVNCFTK